LLANPTAVHKPTYPTPMTEIFGLFDIVNLKALN
jgi:hypothetical protein